MVTLWAREATLSFLFEQHQPAAMREGTAMKETASVSRVNGGGDGCRSSHSKMVRTRKYLKVVNPPLWGGLRRAAQPTAGFRGAQAALWGALERPETQEAPCGQMGRGPQTGLRPFSTISGGARDKAASGVRGAP